MILTAELPSRKKWTVTECDAMERCGILPRKYELIDGEVIEKAPANPPHVVVVQILAIWLEMLFGRAFIREEKAVLLPGEGNRPEPDVSVTHEGMRAYQDHLPGPSDLVLVAEVSDSTLEYDLTTKSLMYAKAGITEYWVLDISGRRLTSFRDPSETGYQTRRELSENEQAETLAHPGITTLVSELLP
jgi:Uma2 family endonuclease